MRRYEAADDFGKPETAFNICTFWRIDALARIGRKAQAREIFEVMLDEPQPAGPAVRGHAPGHRRDVGQLPADLFDGRHDQRRGAAVGAVGHGDLRWRPTRACLSRGMPAMSRLVVVSNRVADPRKTAAGGLAVALGEVLNNTGGLWFGWSGKIVEAARRRRRRAARAAGRRR